MITPGVEALRDDFGLPGMRILQFGFGPDPGADKDLPHRFVAALRRLHGDARQRHDQRLVHLDRGRDHAIPRGRSRPSEPSPCAICDSNGDEIHWDMIRLAFASVADTAIIPLQDILGLDSRAAHEHAGHIRGKLGLAIPERPDRRAVPASGSPSLTAVYSRWNGTDSRGHRPAPKNRGDRCRPPPSKPIRQSTLKRPRECKRSSADFRHGPCRKGP